ncbi:MAG: efflux RND transporter periplasmic adaptor subunit [Carboxylicivirga sp.]|jgi:RND family efflux transporter MFP subunit|nr:efflux RND transporter periplasmic adaptor subunit [Carboxylicivirga sp.]
MKQTNLLLVLLILAAVGLANGCSTSPAEAFGEETVKKSYVEMEAVSVEVQAARRGVFSKELIGNGVLVAKEKVSIPFKVNEQIIELCVKEGQQIKEGQIIATIDAFTFKKSKRDAQNTYNKAIIDLEDLLLSYGYALKDTAKVPTNILKMCRIRSAYNIAVSALEEAEHNLSHTKITAPISGVVTNLQAKVHNHSSQYKYCCQVIDNSIIEVKFHVLEGELPLVGEGQKVQVFPFAMPNVSKTGIITSVNPMVEDGLVKITAAIPNKDGLFLDGMSSKVLVKKEVQDCISIPKPAVLYRQNRKVVFVYKSGVAHCVYVETGMENSTDVCITDGSIKAGDKVIVSNNLNLAHESPVEIEDLAENL